MQELPNKMITFARCYGTFERDMGQVSEKTIDIDSILKSKIGAKAKWVPGFLISWLKRVVHQNEVNKFLWESREKTGTEWLEECVRYLKMTLVVKGKENLPDPNDGKLYTFVNGFLKIKIVLPR